MIVLVPVESGLVPRINPYNESIGDIRYNSSNGQIWIVSDVDLWPPSDRPMDDDIYD